MNDKSSNENRRSRRRIYSRRGDLGETSLHYGPRVGKDQKRIVACGTLDELNSWLGLVLTEEGLPGDVAELLLDIQHRIFPVSAEIASFQPEKLRMTMVSHEDIDWLESQIDRMEEPLEDLNHFIIPGGTRSAALLHLARCVCRRAERRVVALVRADESVSRQIIAWLNRLGDLRFVLARVLNERKN